MYIMNCADRWQKLRDQVISFAITNADNIDVSCLLYQSGRVAVSVKSERTPEESDRYKALRKIWEDIGVLDGKVTPSAKVAHCYYEMPIADVPKLAAYVNEQSVEFVTDRDKCDFVKNQVVRLIRTVQERFK